MKNYSLRFIALGLFCTLVVSTRVYSSSKPENGPITNTTWGSALKKSGKESISQALFVFKYFKLPALAFSYVNPEWRVSRFFNTLSDTKEVAYGLTVSCAVTAISLRYKKQIVESCGDEETAEAWMGVAPLVGFLLPTKISCCAALALIIALQKKEWSSAKKSRSLMRIKPTT